MLAGAISLRRGGLRSSCWGTAMTGLARLRLVRWLLLVRRSVARRIECVSHIDKDGLLRIETKFEAGAEVLAIPSRIPRRTGATVLGSRKRSTYMIVLARWDAIFGRGLVVRLRVGRVASGVPGGGRVAGLAGVSSRGTSWRRVCVGILRGILGVVWRRWRRLCVVVGRPPLGWTGVMIHYRYRPSIGR